MKKTMQKILGVFLVAAFFAPVFSFAATTQSEASKKGETGITYECFTAGTGGGSGLYGNCTWDDFVAAINMIVGIAIKWAIGISVVILAYNGFEIMMAGENAGKRTKARERMQNWAIGIAWMLGAWLVVTMITNALLTDSVKKLLPW